MVGILIFVSSVPMSSTTVHVILYVGFHAMTSILIQKLPSSYVHVYWFL